MIKKIISWLGRSNRWKHLLLGMAIGIGADDWYCTEYVAFGVAGSLELKDKLWGGEPDWIDFTLTVVGVNIGFGIKQLIAIFI